MVSPYRPATAGLFLFLLPRGSSAPIGEKCFPLSPLFEVLVQIPLPQLKTKPAGEYRRVLVFGRGGGI